MESMIKHGIFVFKQKLWRGEKFGEMEEYTPIKGEMFLDKTTFTNQTTSRNIDTEGTQPPFAPT